MDNKLSAHFVWLFAAVAVIGGVGLSIATVKQGWTVTSIALGLLYGGLGCVAAWRTETTRFPAVSASVLAALAIGIIYFIVAKKVLQEAAGAVGVAAKAGTATTMLALVPTVKVLGVTLGAGIGGTLFGFKLRNVKSFGDLLKRPA